MPILGVDVSQFQGVIDWGVLARQARFAFIRATYGSYRDAMFMRNWAAAKAAGVARGAYVYYYQTVAPAIQAAAILAAVMDGGDTGELPIAVDVEEPNEAPGATPIPWTTAQVANLRTCCELIATRTGRSPLIYTNKGYWDAHGLGTTWPYGLWIAQWPEAWSPAMTPALPKAWSTWQFWQYSARGVGLAYGVPAAANPYIDLDVFNGDEAAFAAFAALTGKAPTIRITSNGKTRDVSLPFTLDAA